MYGDARGTVEIAGYLVRRNGDGDGPTLQQH